MINPPFTATDIAKPHKPMLKLKLLKVCICPNTQPLNNATKMKELMRKINNKTPTKSICNKVFSSNSIVLPRSNFCVGKQDTVTQSLTAYTLDRWQLV